MWRGAAALEGSQRSVTIGACIQQSTIQSFERDEWLGTIGLLMRLLN